jgi:DNA repair exonuclease SbcCD ATPase subunit
MTSKEQLIERHVHEYESRLKHIDELYQRAHQAADQLDEAQDAKSRLSELATQRALLQQTTESIKKMPLDHWREETVRSAGPMAIWDILAQQLEDFIERHE